MTAEVPLTRGLVALVDDSDLELVSQNRWHAVPGAYTWYAYRWVRRPDGRGTIQAMHQLLTGWDCTDHKNGNGLDNRRANLREATASQNIRNTRKHRGSSRFKGVCWSKRDRRWRATIELGGHQLYLGVFRGEEAAASAYDDAARRHFGEFAALNFPEPGERSALDVQARPVRTRTTRKHGLAPPAGTEDS